MEQKIPDALITAFQNARGALFVGAGASAAAGYPDWDKLIASYAKDLTPPIVKQTFSASELMAIPQYYKNQNPNYKLALHSKLLTLLKPSGKPVTDLQQAICRIPTNLIYTTNFDTLIEDELNKAGSLERILRDEQDVQEYREHGSKVVLRKLHGCITKSGSIVLAREDFAHFAETHPNTVEDLRFHLRTRPFLFVGYSLRDPDFNAIYDNVLFRNRGYLEHFICLDTVSEHERKDLLQRGLTAISLEGWGVDRTSRLNNFLAELADETTSRHHIKRFFDIRNDEGEEIPIIVSSFSIAEGCVTLPAADNYTAQQIGRDLNSIGHKYKIVPAQHALNDPGQALLNRDLVLICGPGEGGDIASGEGGNLLTKQFFDLPNLLSSCGVGYTFDDPRYEDSLSGRGKIFTSSPLPPVDEYYVEGQARVEFALVGRYRNPWSRRHDSRYVFLFAGIRAIGTHLIGEFLSQRRTYANLVENSVTGDTIERVVEFTYTCYNPANFTWSSTTPPQLVF